MALEIHLLGRVAIEADGLAIEDVRFPGRQGRLLFAYLVSEHGRPVPRDALAEALWGDAVPPTWEKALTVLATKLRAVVGPAGLDGASALTGADGCYRLRLPEGTWVDVLAAVEGTAEAERSVTEGRWDDAIAAASGAESLTREAFLAGDSGGWVEDKRRELADVRASALTSLAEASLRSGAASTATGWAEQVIDAQPFRESGYRRLMAAHAAAGNRAEALRVYERCRRLLAEELGAYPSPETEALYQELLDAPGAPRPSHAVPIGGRAPPPSPPSPPSSSPPQTRPTLPMAASPRRPLRRSIVVAGVVTVAAALVTASAPTRGGRAPTAIPPNSIVALSASGSVETTVAVGIRPVAMTAAEGSLWVANLDDRTVTRIDETTLRVRRSVPVGGVPTALAATPGAVWVSSGAGALSRIDPQYDEPTPAAQLTSAFDTPSGDSWPLLAAYDALWAVDPDGYVARIDPRSGRITGSVDVGNRPSAIAAGAGSVWVANGSDGTVSRIDPSSLLRTTIPVGHGPTAIAADATGAWVTDGGSDALVHVDAVTNTVLRTTPVGRGPSAVLATREAIWVANALDGTVLRVSRRSGQVITTAHVGGSPTALLAHAGRVWVSVAAAAPTAPAGPGDLRVTMKDDVASTDPALLGALAPQLAYATCADLVTYPDRPGANGSQIVPEVADAVPVPTDAGRTYTFTIRPGFRFSPPSNEPVTPATFKATIERVVDRRLDSPAAELFRGIVGYQAYVTGQAAGLSGIVATGNRLTIRLSEPDGSFLAALAGGGACATPAGTPVVSGGLDAVPSAGPYYVASHTPRRQLVLRRNPNYHGERPHRASRIVVTVGVDRARGVAAVEAGTSDYALDGAPVGAVAGLAAKYGPTSAAAKAGHQQYFVTPANGSRLLHMNTSRPLFSDVRLRRAVNYAIDRPALVAVGVRYAEGNSYNAGQVTDDYLPPAIAGAPDLHLYPLDGPDARRAKQLAGARHATAIMYAADAAPWLQEAQIIRANLRPLGIDVEIKTFPTGVFFSRIGRRDEPFDLAVAGWANFNADPADVLAFEGGSAIHATGNLNLSYLDDPAFDRQLHADRKLLGPARSRAYARLQLELERDLAPVAAFATNVDLDLFSARIGCQLDQPVFGMDLGALCLRS